MSMTDEPLRVLLVDDDPMIRSLVRRLLKYAGIDVVEASDSRTAGELLAARAPDVVWTDLHLPDASGLALYERIRAHDASIPVLLVSGDTRPADEIEARLAGDPHAHFIAKPFDVDTVVDTVTRLARERRTAHGGA